MEFQSRVERSMALRVLTYTGLAWEGLLRWREGSGGEEPPGAPLPPVIPFVVYNGHPRWTAPPDVSELIVPTAGELARLQPSNRYVLLDMQRANTASVPGDNAVGLQVALEQAMLEEKLPILHRVEAVLAGPGHAELRQAFTAWLRRSYEEDYGVFAGGGEALRRELDRMENAGEVVAMGSLAAERWKERERKKQAQIYARALERGMEQGLTQGRAKGRVEGRRAVRRAVRRELNFIGASWGVWRRAGSGPMRAIICRRCWRAFRSRSDWRRWAMRSSIAAQARNCSRRSGALSAW